MTIPHAGEFLAKFDLKLFFDSALDAQHSAISFLAATKFWALLTVLTSNVSLTYELFKDFASPAATFIAVMAAAAFARQFGKTQVEVARTQAEIAEHNWQTQNENVILDLFERRISIYDGVRPVLATIMQQGKATNEDYFGYLSATERVSYYFGPEVIGYLEKLRIVVIGISGTR